MFKLRHAFALALATTSVLLYTPNIPVEDLEREFTDAESRWLEVGGMRFHYKLEGNPNAKHSIVLVHGTSSSLHTWDDWTRELIKNDYKVLRMDTLGFGLTGPSLNGDYSIEAYVEFIHSVTSKLGFTKFILAGNSLGGHIAWEYTLTYPSDVTHLVLLAASGFPVVSAPFPLNLVSYPVLDKVLEYVTPYKIFEDTIIDVYHDDSKVSESLVQRYYKLSLREGNRQALSARVKQHKAGRFDKLSTITQPTLIQWGKYDTFIPLGDGHRFKELIPNAELKIYEAGHVPMEEIPEATVKDLIDFVQNYQA